MNKIEEKRFSKILREQLSSNFVVTSFEAQAPPAVPDLYAQSIENGKSLWIEVKSVEENLTERHFRPGQLVWLSTHNACGGSAIVVCLHGENRISIHRPIDPTISNRIHMLCDFDVNFRNGQFQKKQFFPITSSIRNIIT